MGTVKILPHKRFGDLLPGTPFVWGRWFEGQSQPHTAVFTRMKGNRYKDSLGCTWTSGSRVAVERAER